ncbi:MAG: sulfotransferase [bacterium]
MTAKPAAEITRWKDFAARVRSTGQPLLRRLEEFPSSILVTGCQRSGTTMVARLITNSDGMTRYWFGPDDELDAALILSGRVPHQPKGRYCFQTTYLNERYYEYFDMSDSHKVIWILRNPFSVVRSMLHNWKDFALNELFDACGTPYLTPGEYRRYRWLGVHGVSRLVRACCAFQGKVSQLFELRARLPAGNLLILEYEDLVREREATLAALYRFVDLPFRPEYGAEVRSSSIGLAKRLSRRERAAIADRCQGIYEQALPFRWRPQGP